MENQKNLFLAIVISMAIIFGFQLLVPQPERAPISEEQTFEENSVELSIQNTNTQIVINRDEVISSSGRVIFDNGKIKGSINLEGGFIDDLVLEEFRETLDPKNLVTPVSSQKAKSFNRRGPFLSCTFFERFCSTFLSDNLSWTHFEEIDEYSAVGLKFLETKTKKETLGIFE